MMCVAYERSRRGAARLAKVAGLLGVLALTMQPAGAAGPVLVELDQAKVTRVPEGVATIVVGNPMIADISLQTGGVMVITGKGYGTTNIVALDRLGSVVMNESVMVRGPGDGVLVMYTGTDRTTYSCTPQCERRMIPGDGSQFFNAALGQTRQRADAAASSASPPGQLEQQLRRIFQPFAAPSSRTSMATTE